MVVDIDIWRAARLLVDRFGDEAPVAAALRADELLTKGDLDGRRVWLRILKTVEELLAKRPEPGQRVH